MQIQTWSNCKQQQSICIKTFLLQCCWKCCVRRVSMADCSRVSGPALKMQNDTGQLHPLKTADLRHTTPTWQCDLCLPSHLISHTISERSEWERQRWRDRKWTVRHWKKEEKRGNTEKPGRISQLNAAHMPSVNCLLTPLTCNCAHWKWWCLRMREIMK